MYSYYLLHSCYMFRRYYLTIFRELTPTAIKWVVINVHMFWYQRC